LFNTRLLSVFFTMCLVFTTTISASEKAPSVILSGSKTQGGLLIGLVEPDAKAYLGEEQIKVAENGVIVLGFGRDAELAQSLTIISASGKKHIEAINLEKQAYKIQRVNGISKKIMNPNKKNQKRSRADAALVRKARETDSVRQDFLAGFIQPVDGPVTGVYGSQRFYNGQPKRPHFGVDYAAPVGTPVMAPASGKVTMTHNDMFYSGGTLMVDHGLGVSSTFLHLSKILVKEGEEVEQGDIIALVGKSGRATGAHLDWRINWFKVRIDPQKVLKTNLIKVEL
jgi:murein DD-endopeptidase MepM/ murein hydrolase activator NlpD